MFKRHILLMNIAIISSLVFMVLGVLAGIILANALKFPFMYAAVCGGSVVLCLPTFFILRWFKKDYTELASTVQYLKSKLIELQQDK